MKKKYLKYITNHFDSLENKLVLVTGSTGGLGGCLCEYLAMLGADLLLPVRNIKKGEALKAKLQESYPSCKIDIEYIDFESFDLIDQFANIMYKYPKIDYMYVNSGILGIHKESPDIEITLKTNAICSLYFIQKMLPYLNKNARVISTSSVAATMYRDYDFTVYNFYEHKDMVKYCTSKKVLTHNILKYQELYPNYNFILVHPGATATALFGNSSNGFIRLFNPFLKLFFHTKEKAAISLLAGSFLNPKANEWIGPRSLTHLNGYPKVYKLKKELLDKELIEKSYIVANNMMKK